MLQSFIISSHLVSWFVHIIWRQCDVIPWYILDNQKEREIGKKSVFNQISWSVEYIIFCNDVDYG